MNLKSKSIAIINARAPSRVDFSGGTLDIPFFTRRETGVTLNCGIAKYGYVNIFSSNSRNIIVNSLDYNMILTIKKNITYDGKLDLIKAALKLTNFFNSVEIVTRHEMPPHSRLGASSSLSIALLAAIARFRNENLNKEELVRVATEMERKELKLENGSQDQYASAFGGINLLKFVKGKVIRKQVNLKDDILFELEKNLLLCYTGQSTISGDLNKKIREEYEKGNEKIIRALRNIREITFSMYKQLIHGNLEDFAFLLNEERKNREKLSTYIVKGLEKFIDVGLKNGAISAKILGAGGGGTLLFYINEKEIKKFIKKLTNIGATIYNFRFDFSGVKTWAI